MWKGEREDTTLSQKDGPRSRRTDVDLGVETGIAGKRTCRRLVGHTLVSGPEPVSSFREVQ